MNLAPVILFVYNRPNYTEQTLQALMHNELADYSDLYIFSDGAKSDKDEEKVKKVREIIREKKWCKNVIIKEEEDNKGLANSIIEGVTAIINQYGKAIILEDDLISSTYFLRFMNEGLNFYENKEEVISIHGYIYPIKKALPENFFLKGTDCWGWATWKRGWSLFEEDGKKLLEEIKRKNLAHEFDFNGSYPYIKMLKKQIKGENDSWAIRWYASAFLHNKLTLYPNKSLIKNIGVNGEGTHTKKTKKFDVAISNTPININSIPIQHSKIAYNAFQEYFKSIQPTLLQRILHKIKFI